MTAQHLDVIFTPTPNGGLHVGHISRPYRGADLNRRLLDALGSPVANVSHIDKVIDNATGDYRKYEHFVNRITSPQFI